MAPHFTIRAREVDSGSSGTNDSYVTYPTQKDSTALYASFLAFYALLVLALAARVFRQRRDGSGWSGVSKIFSLAVWFKFIGNLIYLILITLPQPGTEYYHRHWHALVGAQLLAVWLHNIAIIILIGAILLSLISGPKAFIAGASGGIFPLSRIFSLFLYGIIVIACVINLIINSYLAGDGARRLGAEKFFNIANAAIGILTLEYSAMLVLALVYVGWYIFAARKTSKDSNRSNQYQKWVPFVALFQLLLAILCLVLIHPAELTVESSFATSAATLAVQYLFFVFGLLHIHF